MSSDSMEIFSQARQIREDSEELLATLRETRATWRRGCDLSKGLLSQAREACAEARNHRHVAFLRRTLYQKAPTPYHKASTLYHKAPTLTTRQAQSTTADAGRHAA